jgi:lysyl-tRNA synthetase class 2
VIEVSVSSDNTVEWGDMANLKELRDERLRKLDEIKKLGINAYPADSNRTNRVNEITSDFEGFENKAVTVAGRIVGIRKFGKLAFIVLKDGSGEMQLFLQKDVVQKTDASLGIMGIEHINLLDVGDFIEASGNVIKSKTDEISVAVTTMRLLTKSLRPMPDKQQGFTDKEQRLRRRYVDLNVNEEVRQRFIRRSKFWQATRQFLLDEGFIEINVPVLEHTTGGADANPFVTHMDALDQDFYLRISHELPLKRLIGGGYEKVFDIGPRFRNENYSDEHLPEHIAMESYAAYQDYEDGMEFYERMIKYVTKETWGTLQFTDVNGFEIDLDHAWPKIKYADIMKEKFDVDVFNPDFDQLKKILKDNGVELDGDININRALDNVWKLIRRVSAGPYWMINEPVSISPLSKVEPSDPRVTQRFHPVIAGSELGNGFSELNDPQDQLERFLEQQELREAGDDEAMMLDIDFVEMLEYGMPPACGWGNSERNFWFFEGVTAREGVIFPNLRSEADEVTKKIYSNVSFEDKSRSKQDFTKRMVLVVSEDIQDWQVANASSHMSAYLGRKISHFDTGEFFETKDNKKYPRNSQYPIVIKVASSKELSGLYDAVEKANITHHGFIKEMIETTNDKKIETILAEKTDDDIVLYGVGVFGNDKEVAGLTDHYELWSGSSTV